jgi:hypothetical protein
MRKALQGEPRPATGSSAPAPGGIKRVRHTVRVTKKPDQDLDAPKIIDLGTQDARYRFRDGTHLPNCGCNRCRMWRIVDRVDAEKHGEFWYGMGKANILAPAPQPPARNLPSTELIPIRATDLDPGPFWAQQGITALHLYQCRHGRTVLCPPTWAVPNESSRRGLKYAYPARAIVRCAPTVGLDGYTVRSCRLVGGLVGGVDAGEQCEAWTVQWAAAQ